MMSQRVKTGLAFLGLAIHLMLPVSVHAADTPQDSLGGEMETPSFLQLPGAHEPYPLSSRNISVEKALKLFSKNLRIGLEVADGVAGEITVPAQGDMTRLDYIEDLALEFDFVWYFDGAMLRVSPVGKTETKVLPLVKHDGWQVIESLQVLDIYQPKFIHRYGARTRTLRITGPADYVALVEEAVEAIDQAERQEVKLVRGDVTLELEKAAAE